MNLKPGLLVMLLPTPNPAHCSYSGEIHVIGRQCRRDPTHWHMDPPVIHGCIDLQWTARWVRVLRDPGEDARDETLDWLPVPTKEHA